jgi:hypothetical protein
LFDRLAAEAVEREADRERVAEALGAATEAMADVLAQQLLADAPRMLKEHRKIRNGFERRLLVRWGPALDLYECVRVCCLEAGEAFHKRHSADSEGNDFKRSALTLLHARACLVASEVQGLLTSGHAVGAQARWRTLHELAVISFIVGERDPEISERFLLHRNVERYKDATQYQKHCEALGYEQFSAEEMEEIRQLHDEVIAKYEPSFRNDWGWAIPLFPAGKKPNFAELEKIAGLEHFRPWVRLSSHGIHSGATGTIHVMGFHSGNPDVMLAGPSNAGLADPGNGALISLNQVTSAFLLHGGTRPQPQDLVILKAIARLLDQAQQKFLEVHLALQAEESAIQNNS